MGSIGSLSGTTHFWLLEIILGSIQPCTHPSATSFALWRRLPPIIQGLLLSHFFEQLIRPKHSWWLKRTLPRSEARFLHFRGESAFRQPWRLFPYHFLCQQVGVEVGLWFWHAPLVSSHFLASFCCEMSRFCRAETMVHSSLFARVLVHNSRPLLSGMRASWLEAPLLCNRKITMRITILINN